MSPISRKTEAQTLRTVWGKQLDRSCPLSEYPRPQLVRPDWLCLNGVWSYAISPGRQIPEQLTDSIVVPFSPESALSGAPRGPQPDETAWYTRSFTLPEGFLRDRLLLQFGAVDQLCEVFVNGRSAGVHQGGYLPFTLDITELIDPLGSNRLTVSVRDLCEAGADCYGKQSREPRGIRYPAQSGIWQTVWLESVPNQYISGVRVTPCVREETLLLELPDGEDVSFAVLAEGKIVTQGRTEGGRAQIHLPGCRKWSPEDPFLYDLLLRRGADLVKVYFAIRQLTAEGGKLYLNGKPVFLSGLLDQGYWPESLYTAPSDEAMIFDIEQAKKLGFRLLRKHLKVEPLRWYYHCDRLGMLVWQDIPNGGDPYPPLWTLLLPQLGFQCRDLPYRRFGRSYERGREQFVRELTGIVSHLRNSPCVICWSLFNEGWGQFDTRRLEALVRQLDPERLVDPASGWHDQGGGDVCSRHIYFRKLKLQADPRVQAITEFGGYSLRIEGHAAQRGFGYRRFADTSRFQEALETLYREQVLPLKEAGLCVCILTQLSDVERELNGLFTYDRLVCKVDAARLAALNRALQEPDASNQKEE